MVATSSKEPDYTMTTETTATNIWLPQTVDLEPIILFLVIVVVALAVVVVVLVWQKGKSK